MQILNSNWLIKMLDKSGNKPDAHLLSLFDILGDWLDAPQIKENLVENSATDSPPTLLLNYLTRQAQAAGAAMPEILAEQILFLATSALNAQDNLAMQHAKQAASALITAQCEKETTPFKLNKPIYAVAAGLVCALAIGAMIFTQQTPPTVQAIAHRPRLQQDNIKQVAADSPKQTAELYASIETMRGGDCQFIEALQIPDADKKIYLENVVGGQAPSNAHDQMIAQRYLQKIRCNYTPMLMKNSTN